MTRRVTISLDEEILKKLRKKQAKQIQKSSTSISLSKIINETLQHAFKN